MHLLCRLERKEAIKMPITQLDMISMAPKSQEASQIKHTETVRTAHEQAQISTDFKKEVKHNSMQTTKATKSEIAEYRYDAKEKGNNTYSYPYQQQKKKKKQDGDKKENTPIKLSNFDIKI